MLPYGIIEVTRLKKTFFLFILYIIDHIEEMHDAILKFCLHIVRLLVITMIISSLFNYNINHVHHHHNNNRMLVFALVRVIPPCSSVRLKLLQRNVFSNHPNNEKGNSIMTLSASIVDHNQDWILQQKRIKTTTKKKTNIHQFPQLSKQMIQIYKELVLQTDDQQEQEQEKLQQQKQHYHQEQQQRKHRQPLPQNSFIGNDNMRKSHGTSNDNTDESNSVPSSSTEVTISRVSTTVNSILASTTMTTTTTEHVIVPVVDESLQSLLYQETTIAAIDVSYRSRSFDVDNTLPVATTTYDLFDNNQIMMTDFRNNNNSTKKQRIMSWFIRGPTIIVSMMTSSL